MNKAKHATPTMPLKKAVHLSRTTLEGWWDSGVPVNDPDAMALETLINFADIPDDIAVANGALVIFGCIMAALAACCTISGVTYIFMGQLDAGAQLVPYAGIPALLAVLSLRGVRK